MVGHASMYKSVQMYEKGMYTIGSIHDILVDDGLVGVSRKTLEPRQKMTDKYVLSLLPHDICKSRFNNRKCYFSVQNL